MGTLGWGTWGPWGGGQGDSDVGTWGTLGWGTRGHGDLGVGDVGMWGHRCGTRGTWGDLGPWGGGHGGHGDLGVGDMGTPFWGPGGRGDTDVGPGDTGTRGWENSGARGPGDTEVGTRRASGWGGRGHKGRWGHGEGAVSAPALSPGVTVPRTPGSPWGGRGTPVSVYVRPRRVPGAPGRGGVPPAAGRGTRRGHPGVRPVLPAPAAPGGHGPGDAGEPACPARDSAPPGGTRAPGWDAVKSRRGGGRGVQGL